MDVVQDGLDRSMQSMAFLWRKAKQHPDQRVRQMLMFFIEQGIRGMSVLNRYKPIQHGRIGGSQVGLDLPGVFYVPSIISEVSPWAQFEGKLDRLVKAFSTFKTSIGNAIIGTGSAHATTLPKESVDYIFTDPPFGENIYYSDLNFFVESWHGVTTAPASEAIIDRVKKKGIPEYQLLMQKCFAEYYRVLKPGRWMTVVFSNIGQVGQICARQAPGQFPIRHLDGQRQGGRQRFDGRLTDGQAKVFEALWSFKGAEVNGERIMQRAGQKSDKPIDLFKIKSKDKGKPEHEARLAAYGALVVTQQRAGLYSMHCAAAVLA